MARAEARRLITGLLVAAAVGCGTKPPEDALATWDGGFATAVDLDRHLLDLAPGRRVAPPGVDRLAWLEDRLREVFLDAVVATPEAQAAAAAAEGFAERLRAATDSRLVRAYLRRHDAKLTVEMADAERYFDTHREQFVAPERRSFRTLFKAAPRGGAAAERASVREAVAELRRQAVAGASFEALARQHSESSSASAGGLVGPVSREQLRGDVGRVVFARPPGEVSEVLETPEGFHLVQVAAVQPATGDDFEAHRFRVLELLSEQERDAYFAELVRQEAASRGIALLAWPEIGLPAGADASTPVLQWPEDPVTVGEVVQRARAERRDLRAAYLRLAGERLFAAAERSADPAAAEAVTAELAGSMARREAVEGALQAWVAALPTERKRQFFADRGALFTTEPELELAVFEWPLGDSDPRPVAAAARAYADRLAADDGDAREAWPAEEARGAVRRALPLLGLRQLAAREPTLVQALPATLAAGVVVGPLPDRGRLLVARVTTFVPARPLAFEEVETRLAGAMLADDRAGLQREWAATVAAGHRLEIRRDRLESFGSEILAVTVGGGSEGE